MHLLEVSDMNILRLTQSKIDIEGFIDPIRWANSVECERIPCQSKEALLT